jgi:hypothetical protein
VNDTFEDQLRADLHAAAGHPAYGSIDPAEVIGEGRRVVRRRHRLQAVGAAAAVAVLGVGGFLVTDTGRTTTTPPAHHSPTVPTGSSVVFHDLSTNLNGLEVPGPAWVRVDLDQTTGAVTYTFNDGKDTSASGHASVAPGGGSITWSTGDGYPNLVVGVAPAPAIHLTDIGGRGGTGGSTSDVKLLPGTPYQAFVRLYSATESVSQLQGFVWVDSSGAVRTSDRAVKAYSAGFAGLGRAPSRLATVPDWDWLGVFDDDGASSVWISEAAGTFGNEVPRVEMGRLDGTATQVTVAGLLPAGASLVTPSYALGAGSHPLLTAPLKDAEGSPGPYTGFFAQFRDEEPKRAPTPWLTGIAWTDAGGQRHQGTLR